MANTGTIAGMILGTAAYMSPEQARGKPVDKRADVWSFGVLLWEMLTGGTLFAGDTVTDVIAQVVTKEPDLDALPKGTPGAVRHLLARCLRKDPRTRLPDMGAARLDLQDALAGAAETTAAPERDGEASAPAEVRRLSRQKRVWAAVALASAGIAAVLAFVHLTETHEPPPAIHFVLDTPEDLILGQFEAPAVSPDGRHVAFAAGPPGEPPRLWLRSLSSPEARTLPGTESASRPFWSPDGETIAFAADGQLKKVTLTGGAVQRICALPRGLSSGTWNAEGTIVFSNEGGTANLFSVPASGGEAQKLAAHDESRQETSHWEPRFLPDGRRFLLYIQGAETGLHVASLEDPDQRLRLLSEGPRAAVAAGHLLFVRDDILLAQPFDAVRGELTGNATPVVEGVGSWSGMPGWGWFSAAEGALAYREDVASEVQLAWFDRKGDRLGTLGKPGRYGQIALSPDGRRVVVEIGDRDGYDLWVIDVARGVATRLTTDPADEMDPVWAPNSQELAYASDKSGDQNVLLQGLSGGDPLAAPRRPRGDAGAAGLSGELGPRGEDARLPDEGRRARGLGGPARWRRRGGAGAAERVRPGRGPAVARRAVAGLHLQ